MRYLFYISENYSFKVLRPLQREIMNRGDQVRWFVEGQHVNLDYFKEDEERLASVADVVAFAPRAVFVPGNMVPSFIPGLKISVFHGFIGGKTRKKDGEIYHFIIRGCFDLYCTHGPSTTARFEELAQKYRYFKAVETGWCQMDNYLNEELSSQSKKNRSSRPTVLFSSTFSRRITKAPALLETVKKLSQNSKWRWQVTFHPKMDQSIVDAYKAIQHENLTFVETDDLTPFMLNADVMLGDYSSMMLDFILLNKPVVTFGNPDNPPYVLNVHRHEEIEDAVAQALTHPEKLMKEMDALAKSLHPYKDGKSSARVLDAVEEELKNLSIAKSKPLNIIRNLKLRKKLSYWRI